MLYEELQSKIMNVYGYPVGLIEEPTVMEAVKELVSDRKKLLSDKRSLMKEVIELKERLRTSSSLPVEDGSKSPSLPSGRRDGLDGPQQEQ